MQREWKGWQQTGRRRISSPGRKRERQTAQSAEVEVLEPDLAHSETWEVDRMMGGVEEVEDADEEEDREWNRRRRWMAAEARQTATRIAAMMRRLELKEEEVGGGDRSPEISEVRIGKGGGGAGGGEVAESRGEGIYLDSERSRYLRSTGSVANKTVIYIALWAVIYSLF